MCASATRSRRAVLSHISSICSSLLACVAGRACDCAVCNLCVQLLHRYGYCHGEYAFSSHSTHLNVSRMTYEDGSQIPCRAKYAVTGHKWVPMSTVGGALLADLTPNTVHKSPCGQSQICQYVEKCCHKCPQVCICLRWSNRRNLHHRMCRKAQIDTH